ncbi:unnamed protein product [Rotaria sordida]|uniref:Uncharacterized protein n=2 Tax=Rotaria sordida TaxID=392033 RepID=A0A815A7M4_9BILA|nr:unnamed protein product [Rotaria sordida]
MEHLEHVPERIGSGNTCRFGIWDHYFGIFRNILGAMENPIILLNRAHQVVLGTQLEHLEHVPERIGGGITCRQVINNDKNNQQVGQNVPPPLLNNNNNVQQLNHLELNSRSKEKHSFLYFF